MASRHHTCKPLADLLPKKWFHLSVLWGLLMFEIYNPSPVFSQSDSQTSALARTLFKEGVKLVESEQWEAAADKLRRALTLRSSSVIAYNLAYCVSHLGKLVEASELLEQVKRDPETNKRLKETAQTLLQEINPRIARLKISPKGDLTDVEVVLDDRVLNPAELGVSVPIDPGQHTLIARRDGSDIVHQQIEITEASDQEVSLDIPEPETIPEPLPEPQPLEDKQKVQLVVASLSDSDEGIGLWTWVTLGTGAASLIGAAVFELLRQGAEEDARNAPQKYYVGEFETMESYQTAARVFLGVGAALSITGAVLLILDLNNESEDATTTMAFGCQLQTCSTTLKSTFW